MYRVLVAFGDLQDSLFQYKVGDVYPREGYSPTNERIAELASDENKVGVPLITKVEEKKVEVLPEDKPEKKSKGKPKRKG